MDSTKVTTPQETKLHFLDYWRIIRIRKTVILSVFLLVVMTATLVTWILPESYSSTARIKVERDQSDIASVVGQMQMTGYDPFFIQTEFEVIQSAQILGLVIKELNLNKTWGAKYANGETLKTTETMNLLRGRLSLRPVRNTSLIEISVLSEKPDEAARIAEEIAKQYQKYRLEVVQRLSTGGIQALIAEKDRQDLKITEAQGKVDELRKTLRIPDSMAEGNTPTVLMTAETLRHLNALRIESDAEYVRQSTLLRSLGALKQAELRQVLPTAAQDNLLGSLLEQLTIADQKLIGAQADFGPKSPEYNKDKDQVSDLNSKIDLRVNGIMKGLGAKVDSLGQGLTNLMTEVEKAKQEDIDMAKEAAPYFEAKRRLEELRRSLVMLETKIHNENIDKDLPRTGMVEILDDAVPGMRPVRPNKPLNIALGIIIGLVVGVGLAFFIEYLDTSVKTIDDVERALQSPVLGVIPQNVGLMLDEGAESPHAEAYRVLRTNLLFSRKDDKLNSLAVVSAGAGEGKSTTVFNLASVFAQSGQRVVVVDSDLRRPTLHKMVGVTNAIGLTNYLLKQNTIEEVIQTSNVPGLDFMASGKLPSSSLGILSSAQMKDLINELKQRYDFVFFDSPPIMGVSDASILASEVDMTLQVIQYRRYPQPMNIRAKQLIEKVGGNLVGIVLNNINMSQDESYYYYSGYYHDYYYRSSEEADPAVGGKGKDKGAGGKPKLDIKPKY